MFCYRITKYNPQHRALRGSYLKDEWISYSDIGKTFESITLTYDAYLAVETAYIHAILAFMDCLHIKALRATHVEHNQIDTAIFQKDFGDLANNIVLNKERLTVIARMVLREQLWCKFESPNKKMRKCY